MRTGPRRSSSHYAAVTGPVHTGARSAGRARRKDPVRLPGWPGWPYQCSRESGVSPVADDIFVGIDRKLSARSTYPWIREHPNPGRSPTINLDYSSLLE